MAISLEKKIAICDEEIAIFTEGPAFIKYGDVFVEFGKEKTPYLTKKSIPHIERKGRPSLNMAISSLNLVKSNAIFNESI